MTSRSPFAARALAERTQYDGVLARALAHGADRDVLSDAVREVADAADPLAAVLDATAFAATCDALVGTVASLAATGRWRAGSPERRAVLDVVPRVVPWLAAAPAVTVAAVVDGARAVGGGPRARGDVGAWAGRVADAAHASAPGPGAPSHPTSLATGPVTGRDAAEMVRGAVLVAAWRGGLVRYRDAALAAARSLPEPVARAALSLPGTVDLRAALTRHADDPWWWPGQEDDVTTTVLLPGVHEPAHVLGRFGGFRGFGGPWLSPAVVVGADARNPGLRWALLAPDDADRTRPTSGTADWTLVADVHGSLLARTPSGDPGGTAATGEPDAVAMAGTFPAEGLPTSDDPASARADDLTDVSGSVSVTTLSGRLALLSRTGSYDVLLVRWTR